VEAADSWPCLNYLAAGPALWNPGLLPTLPKRAFCSMGSPPMPVQAHHGQKP
jgi:hypothetical protein